MGNARMRATSYLGWNLDRAYKRHTEKSKYNDTRDDVLDANYDAIFDALDMIWFDGTDTLASFDASIAHARNMRDVYKTTTNYHDETYYRVYASNMTKYRRIWSMYC